MSQLHLHIDDFATDAHQDATAAWQKLLAAMPQALERAESNECGEKALHIHFSPGEYHFYPDASPEYILRISNHHQVPSCRCGIYLEHAANISIHGHGAAFIIHHTTLPIALLHCKKLLLEELTIDYQYPKTHQGRVMAVDQSRRSVTLKMESKEPFEISPDARKLHFTGEDNYRYPVHSVIHFQSNGRMCYNQPDFSFQPGAIRQDAPDTITCLDWRDDLTPGMHIVFRPFDRPTPAILLHGCKDALIRNLTVHYAFGMGMLAQLSTNVTLDGFKVQRRTTPDAPFFTTHADATHFSCCSGNITCRNGFFEGMNDDAINVHGIYLLLQEVTSPTEIRGEYARHDGWGFPWAEAGDTIRLVRRDTLEYVTPPLKIAAIEALDEQGDGPKKFRIRLKEALPPNLPETPLVLENLSRCPDVEFTGNTIRNNRARGALFSTTGEVKVQHNCFDHVHGSGILLSGDCNGWFESGPCRNLEISHNRFIHNLSAIYQFTQAIISIYPVIPKEELQPQPYHSGINIHHNHFITFQAPILYAAHTRDLHFHHNHVEFAPEYPPLPELTQKWCQLQQVHNAQVEENSLP